MGGGVVRRVGEREAAGPALDDAELELVAAVVVADEHVGRVVGGHLRVRISIPEGPLGADVPFVLKNAGAHRSGGDHILIGGNDAALDVEDAVEIDDAVGDQGAGAGFHEAKTGARDRAHAEGVGIDVDGA